jgi:hypothetical protein
MVGQLNSPDGAPVGGTGDAVAVALDADGAGADADADVGKSVACDETATA